MSLCPSPSSWSSRDFCIIIDEPGLVFDSDGGCGQWCWAWFLWLGGFQLSGLSGIGRALDRVLVKVDHGGSAAGADRLGDVFEFGEHNFIWHFIYEDNWYIEFRAYQNWSFKKTINEWAASESIIKNVRSKEKYPKPICGEVQEWTRGLNQPQWRQQRSRWWIQAKGWGEVLVHQRKSQRVAPMVHRTKKSTAEGSPATARPRNSENWLWWWLHVQQRVQLPNQKEKSSQAHQHWKQQSWESGILRQNQKLVQVTNW